MKRFPCAILLMLDGCACTGSPRPDAAPAADVPAEAVADVAAADTPATTPVRGTGACADVEIAYFVATPSTIDPGAASTLSWEGRMARGCDLQPGAVGFGGGPLSFAVMPSSTTEYSLRCFATACVDTNEAPVARVTVTVR